MDMAREAGNDDLFDAMQVAFLERFEALVRADERNALTKERDKLRNRIAYLLQPPIVVAVGCFLLAYIVGFK
jgi:hypothetical protein